MGDGGLLEVSIPIETMTRFVRLIQAPWLCGGAPGNCPVVRHRRPSLLLQLQLIAKE